MDRRHIAYLNDLKKIRIPGYEWLSLDALLFNELWYALIKRPEDLCVFEKKYEYEVKIRNENSQGLLLTYYRQRNDRDNYCSTISALTHNYLDEIVIREKDELKNIITINDNRYYEFLSCIDDDSIRLYISEYIEFQIDYLEKLRGIIDNYDKLLCYYDGGRYENIIVQYFRSTNRKTYSVQHGQPIYRNVEYDRINQAQILNFNSDVFLAVNNFTRDEFIKAGIDRRRIHVVGSFKNISDYIPRATKKFGVFLNSPSLPFALETNIKMLRYAETLASQHGYQFVVKIHPNDEFDYYEETECLNGALLIDKALDVTQTVINIEFALCHASSIYMDMYCKRIRPFVMRDSVHEYRITDIESDYFSSYEELENKVKVWLGEEELDKELYIAHMADRVLNYEGAAERLKKEFDN